MKIEVLYSEGCHTWKESLELLKRILTVHNIPTNLELIKIDTQEKAKKFNYFGSPQINFNGIDIDPLAREVTNYKLTGCRLYFHKETTYEFPPEEMITDALKVKGLI